MLVQLQKYYCVMIHGTPFESLINVLSDNIPLETHLLIENSIYSWIFNYDVKKRVFFRKIEHAYWATDMRKITQFPLKIRHLKGQ